jgi:hypothetical protein
MLQPTLGRFMQRDPIGYKDGMNLYTYELSSPITGTDSRGLAKEGEFIENDLGQQQGRQIAPNAWEKGNTKTQFHVTTIKVTRAKCPQERYQIELPGWHGSADYWWEDEEAKAHELNHVGIGRDGWNDLYGYAASKKNKCYCQKEAVCWRDAIGLKYKAVTSDVEARNWEFDAAEYGNTFPSVKAQAAKKRKAADAAIAEFNRKDQECSKMQEN